MEGKIYKDTYRENKVFDIITDYYSSIDVYSYKDEIEESIDDIKTPLTTPELNITRYISKDVTNECQKNINLIHGIKMDTTLPEEDVFKLDEEYPFDDEVENSNTKSEKEVKSLLLNFNLSNTSIGSKKEYINKNSENTTHSSSIGQYKKTNSKPIKKTTHTSPASDIKQKYEQEKDIFDDFDFTDYNPTSEVNEKKIEIEDDEIDINSIKPLYTSNPIQIVKKEQENLQNTLSSLIVAGTSIKLFNSYIQQSK